MVGDVTKLAVLTTLVALCVLTVDAGPCFSRGTEPAAVMVLATGPTRHVIRSGDTISLLAHRYGVSAAAILKANPGLDPGRLQLGRTLNIPEVGNRAAGGGVPASAPANASGVELRPEKAPQATPPLQERELAHGNAQAPAPTPPGASPTAAATPQGPADAASTVPPAQPAGEEAAPATVKEQPQPTTPMAVDKVGERTRIAFGGTAIFVDQIVPWTISLGSRVLSALLMLAVGIWVANRLGWLLQRMLARKNVPPEIISFASSLTRYGLYLVVLIAALGQLGLNVSSLLALFGAAGLAVSLALKDTLSNFASGVMLLLFRFFRVGDRVSVPSVAGASGVVETVDIFNTIIRSDAGDTIIVPNAKIVGNIIVVGAEAGTTKG